MGLHITVKIHQVDDLVIDDVQALNQDLMDNSDLGEIYDSIKPGTPAYGNRYTGRNDVFEGIFRYSGSTLELAGVDSPGSFNQYGDYTTVWGCWHEETARVIANHITQGKLVMFQEIEGNPNCYWIITPGEVVEMEEGQLRF